MKLFYAFALCALTAAGAATAATGNPTVAKKSVSYVCQQGKKLTVSYGFNKQGMPNYAVAKLNGRNRIMDINLDRSDNVDNFFIDEGGYTLGTGNLTTQSYRKLPVMITSPKNEILFKNCMPR